MTEKTCEFRWSDQCEEAFRKLKRSLSQAPILAFPDFTKTFVLDTDASNDGIGAVLSQEDNGRERVIAYASRVLSKAERRYCVTRRELLAVVKFLQHFRPYLLGRHFIVRTDHGSLTWLRNFKNPENQLARWLEQLQEYDFDIVHRPGHKHGNADALSRVPCKQCGRESHAELEESYPVIAAVQPPQELIAGLSQQELREAQLADPNLTEILKAKEAGTDAPPRTPQGQAMELQRLTQLWNQLRVKDGLLWREFEDEQGPSSTLQLVVPRKYREQIVMELHSGAMGGHLAVDKTHSRLKERFYWPGYWKDVQLCCQACTSCATRKTPAPKRKAPMQPIWAGYPLEIVAMDLTGPFPESPSGNRYILVVGDYFTKWMRPMLCQIRKHLPWLRNLWMSSSAVSLSPVASIQTKGNSLNPRLYLPSASYYRLTSPRLPLTIHSQTGLLNDSIVRWQQLQRSTPLSGKGTYRRYALHITPVCMHPRDRPLFS